ncbi:unnamed protein product [Diatraea saccharalis]|uniref:Uncharacterized protein n=1 Tax=Diatraea saccharalis TaxID=40085 RepID=A0A9N9WCW5_9NEOP|nr:unnamed protein product [Diatraea saccharalis]
MSYEDRLSKFNITSLNTRRYQHDLITLHKLVHSVIDSEYIFSSVNINFKYNPRRRLPTFVIPTYRYISFHNPIARMCRSYNEILPVNQALDIFNANLFIFKNCIKKIVVDLNVASF